VIAGPRQLCFIEFCTELFCYNCAMFERFTESAGSSIFYAKYCATSLGSSFVSSEHLLLGIFAEEDLATHLLRPASLATIISQIKQERSSGPGTWPEGANLPLSDEAKEILRLSAEEADRLQDKNIGNEHLLMGLLKEGKCYAADLLMKQGVSLETLQEQLASVRKDPFQAPRTSLRHLLPGDPTWAELGIPEGYAWPQLVFNPPAETMILQVKCRHIWLPTRLFIKHKDAEKYMQLGTPDEMTSYESPVTSLKQPLLAFNVMTWRKSESGVGGDWKELQVIDLRTGIVQNSIKHGEVILPEGFDQCSVGDLLAMSDNGGQVYVRALLSNASQSRIIHVLAILDLNLKRLDPISKLRGVFF